MRQSTSRTTAHAAATTCIESGNLYTRQGFIKASGVSATRLAAAAAQGIKPKWLKVGRRLYVAGEDGIRFIRELAAQESAKADREKEIARFGDC